MPLKLFEFIGLFFCVVLRPIDITWVFYYNTNLRIMVNFSAINGNIFSSYHLLGKGLLKEYFCTPLSTICNTPSLHTKNALFSKYLNLRINLYLGEIEEPLKYKRFMEKNIAVSWSSHLQALKPMS